MKNKIILAIGWFGVLTPVYALGALTVLLALNYSEAWVMGRIAVVGVVNGIVGWRILRMARTHGKAVKAKG